MLLCRFTDGTTRASFDDGRTWRLPRRWSWAVWLLGDGAAIQSEAGSRNTKHGRVGEGRRMESMHTLADSGHCSDDVRRFACSIAPADAPAAGKHMLLLDKTIRRVLTAAGGILQQQLQRDSGLSVWEFVEQSTPAVAPPSAESAGPPVGAGPCWSIDGQKFLNWYRGRAVIRPNAQKGIRCPNIETTPAASHRWERQCWASGQEHFSAGGLGRMSRTSTESATAVACSA